LEQLDPPLVTGCGEVEVLKRRVSDLRFNTLVSPFVQLGCQHPAVRRGVKTKQMCSADARGTPEQPEKHRDVLAPTSFAQEHRRACDQRGQERIVPRPLIT